MILARLLAAPLRSCHFWETLRVNYGQIESYYDQKVVLTKGWTLSPANVHDSKTLIPAIDQLRTSKRVRMIAADSAFDVQFLRSICADNILFFSPQLTSEKTKKKTIYKRSHQWVVERSSGWLVWFRELKICWAKTLISHLAFLQLAASIQLFKMGGIFV